MAAGSTATVKAETLKFTVADGGAAGVHTGTITVPAHTVILDVIVHATALWNSGTSATLIVGDDADPDGFFTAVDLKATDLLAGESLSLGYPAGQFGAYVTVDYTSVATIGASYVDTRQTAAERDLSATITLVGTAATTGETYVTFVYAIPNLQSAAYTAS